MMNTLTHSKSATNGGQNPARTIEKEEGTNDLKMLRAAKAEASPLILSADAVRAILSGEIHPLTAWRNAAGLTQGALAIAAGVKRAATISDIESGKIDPRLSTLKAISGALKLDLDDIVA